MLFKLQGIMRCILSIIFFELLFSQNYPNYEIIEINNPYPDPLFLYIMSEENKFMTIFDSDINVKWHVHSNNMGLDFKVNQNYLSYFHRTDGSWILLDTLMIEKDTLWCESPYMADYHDIQILENGNYIIQAYDSRFIDMSNLVEGGQNVAWIKGILILQEFNSDHELIFHWDAWEHLDIVDYTNLILTADNISWMHSNSIEVDNDGHLLISNRASSEIFKINKQTNEVIWHLGGPLNEFDIINDSNQGFSMQHDVRRLENGNIMLFDNGVLHTPPISRVLEYEIDENQKNANLVWEYIHPDSLLGLAMGSAQRLPNGNTLINWGTISHQGAIITEVTYEGIIALEIRYPIQYKAYKARKNNWSFSVNTLDGDTNFDGAIDIMDLNYIIDFNIQENANLNIYHLFRYDLDKNGIINSSDIEVVIDLLLEIYTIF